jgi:TolB-like protein/DNA-binding winged helix-turn-helix (wHTH) protein/tetratricopeptide (TPR) repeat protein
VGNTFQIASWLVQPSLNAVSLNGTTVHLEPKVMEVLVFLAAHPGETIPKEKLIQAVWPGTFVTDDVLTRSIFELRRVFGDDAKESHVIQTIPKRGYRLVAPVKVLPDSQAACSPAAGTAEPHAAVAPLGKRRHRFAMLGIAGALLLIGLGVAFKNDWVRDRLGFAKSPSIHSLAVLPLQNLSGDPAQEYFADGMTDGLIGELSQIVSVRVISRTSVMRYKTTDKTLPQIARELGVDGIVEGTVQRSGNRVRITAQLLFASTESHLWADTYERNLEDVFSLERDLSQEIAHQIRARLQLQEQAVPALTRTINVQALEAYLQGEYHLDRGGRGVIDEEYRDAAGYFQQAIDAEPSFVLAYVGLARAYEGRFLLSTEDRMAMERAGKKIMELAPGTSIAAMFSGDEKANRWDWTGAEAEYQTAVALDPGSLEAHRRLARFLDALGRLDDAWKEWLAAQELNPNPDRLPWALDRPTALALRGKCDQALPLILRILEDDPKDGQTHLQLSGCYRQQGRYREGIQELGRVAALYGHPEIEVRLNRTYDEGGRQGGLRQWAREIEHLQDTKQMYLPWYLAAIYGELGDKEKVFYWLGKAYEVRNTDPGLNLIGMLTSDPDLKPIRNDPRYVDLLRRAGLPAENSIPAKQ